MPAGADGYWTLPRMERLRELVAEGLSASEIVADLNAAAQQRITRAAVIGKIHRLGLREAWARMAPQRPPKVVAANGAHVAVARPQPQVARQRPPPPPPRVHETPSPPPRVHETPPSARRPRSLLALAHGDCRWPFGDPRLPGFAFCGAPALPGRSYCARHERRAHLRA